MTFRDVISSDVWETFVLRHFFFEVTRNPLVEITCASLFLYQRPITIIFVIKKKQHGNSAMLVGLANGRGDAHIVCTMCV